MMNLRTKLGKSIFFSTNVGLRSNSQSVKPMISITLQVLPRLVAFISNRLGHGEFMSSANDPKVEKSTVTKADIVEKVYQKIGFSKKEASELVEMVFDQLKTTLCKGEKVKISGFGNFLVRAKNERIGRNPQTGEQIKISARRVLTFRPSQVLKAILNGEDASKVVEDDND